MREHIIAGDFDQWAAQALSGKNLQN